MCRSYVARWAGLVCLVCAWNIPTHAIDKQRTQDKQADDKPKQDSPLLLKEKFHSEFDFFLKGATFSPDGKLLAAGDQKAKIVVWEVSSWKEKLNLRPSTALASLTFDHNGRQIIATIASKKPFESETKSWDIATGREALLVDGKNAGGGIVFHPDGKQLAMAVGIGSIQFRNAESWELRRTLSPHFVAITDLLFSPDGKTIASASTDKTIKISDTQSGEELKTLKGHEGGVNGISFSPSGKWIASASRDKTVRIWNTKSGDVVRTIPLKATPTKVAFSPDGKWLAVGIGGGTTGVLSIRDAVTGREVLVVKNQTYGCNSLIFNRDGTLLASACGRFVTVWEVSENKGAAISKDLPGAKQ
jgi:WD40 repeat protein